MLERQAKVLDSRSAIKNNMPLKSDCLPAQPALAREQVSRAFSLAVLLCAAMAALVPAAQGATYKWIDDKGVVHYSDKMPPEAINKASVELNKEGITVKKNDPAMTPDQRRVRDAEEERVRQTARAHEEIERKDRALLQTYTTESEIDLARRRALGTIDGQVQSAQAYTATLNKRKQEISTRVATFGDQPLPPSIERELTSVNDELDKQAELIASKRKEIAMVNARYDADKRRWQELAANAPTTSAAANTSPAPAAAMPASTKK